MPTVTGYQEFERFLNRLKVSDSVVVDVETTGLNPRKNHIISYVITFGPLLEDTYMIPLRHQGGGNFSGVEIPDTVDGWRGDAHLVELELAKEFAARPRTIIGHNLLFDLLFLARHNIFPSGKLVCTQMTQALLDEYQYSYSLDTCAKVMGVEWKKGDALYARIAELFGGEPVKDQMANFWRTSATDPIVVDYTVGDGVSTWQLYEAQLPLLEKEDLTYLWGVECRVTRALFNMQWLGVKVDENYLNSMSEKLQTETAKLTCKLPQMKTKAGFEDFNVRSAAHLKKYFTETLGYTKSALQVTEKGNYSFNEGWLKLTEHGREIIKIRQYSNLTNSFILPLIDTHIHKGRVHTWFNQLKGDDFGTVTGRLSSNSPNMQQVPRRNKELGPLFRRAFIPDEGYLWSSNDMSQAEYRLFTVYSQEKNLLEAYANDGDIHTLVSTRLGIDRDVAKRLNLAVLYGAGAAKIAEMLEIKQSEATKLQRDYLTIIPTAKSLRDQMKSRAHQNGYVRSMLRRRARFGNGKEFPHKAMSRVIQGSNADYIKIKLADVNDYFDQYGGEDIKMLLTIHDSLDWQVKEGAMHHNTKALEIFGNSDIEGSLIKFDNVQMKIDHKIGRTWAEATYG